VVKKKCPSLLRLLRQRLHLAALLPLRAPRA
jgi:hypothetical protein